jgi:regulator of cell morphogenesis and NO signaling
MTDTAHQTIGELIIANPAAATTFQRLGLDFCCQGHQTLADACTTAGLDPDQVLAQVAGEVAHSDEQDWSNLPAGALSEHIEVVHHRYLYTELPELVELAAKVASVHAGRHPELTEVQSLVEELQADLVPHMTKEDRVLFPAIRALEAGPASFGFGAIANPISVMTAEHEVVGGLLRRIEAATGHYQVPADGCASYQSLYRRLEQIEADTHLHVFKENSVLFPKAVALQADRQAGTHR